MENQLKIQRYLKQYGRCWYNLDLIPFTVNKFDLIRDFFIQYNKTLPYGNKWIDEKYSRYNLIKILDGENERFFVIESPVVRNNLINGSSNELKHVHFLFELTDGDFIEITDNSQEKFRLYSKVLLEKEVERKELIKVVNNDTVQLDIGQVTVENNDNVAFDTENDTENINMGKNNNEISW